MANSLRPHCCHFLNRAMLRLCNHNTRSSAASTSIGGIGQATNIDARRGNLTRNKVSWTESIQAHVHGSYSRW